MKNPFKKTKPTARRSIRKSSDVSVNKYISPRKNNVQQNKRKSSKRRRALLQLAGILLIVFGISYLLASSSRVTEVDSPLEQEVYQQFVSEYIGRNPVSSFKPFITQQGVEMALLDNFPEVESAEVDISFFGPTMYIDVSERSAQLVLHTKDDKYLIVDRNGYAYSEYDPKKPSENAVILNDTTDVNYDLYDNRYVPSSLVAFIETVDGSLKASKQLKGQSFSYRISDDARIVYIKPSKAKYEIKMQYDKSAEEQVYTYIQAYDYYKKKSFTPVKYVDVRVSGTVYYK